MSVLSVMYEKQKKKKTNPLSADVPSACSCCIELTVASG